VPFESDHRGDFSGSSTVIYDPRTRVLSADGSRLVSVEPFPGNIIPTDRIHKNSAFLLQNFYPLPNNVTKGYTQDFLSNETATANTDQELTRIDWTQSAKSSFVFRYSHGNEPQYIPAAIPRMGTLNTIITHQGMLGHTLVPSHGFPANRRDPKSVTESLAWQPLGGRRSALVQSPSTLAVNRLGV
jgi:hypothetical protein